MTTKFSNPDSIPENLNAPPTHIILMQDSEKVYFIIDGRTEVKYEPRFAISEPSLFIVQKMLNDAYKLGMQQGEVNLTFRLKTMVTNFLAPLLPSSPPDSLG